jgi:glycosyltransferase involved in cell wall biosynthesis
VTWWPVAGALGLTALLRGRRGRSAALRQEDEIDQAALDGFRTQYGEPELGPVVVVIAAYNEADGIPSVLPALPEQVCGLHADVLVVDDGSSDGTATALAGSRAFVVACPQNRGQGAALRLGYRVAREHGAAYVITTDADGQYDVADFPTVLTPILDGRADFVSGSRIRGHQHTLDKVRRLGVHVFAALATLLTGRRLTDTSFGLRAMRAEVTAAVTLNQPQYQSSELLLGALAHGFRVLEVPGTMHVRAAGASKKGRNLAYGSSYARAMTGTWWREGCPRPVPETAPALRQTRGHETR